MNTKTVFDLNKYVSEQQTLKSRGLITLDEFTENMQRIGSMLRDQSHLINKVNEYEHDIVDLNSQIHDLEFTLQSIRDDINVTQQTLNNEMHKE